MAGKCGDRVQLPSHARPFGQAQMPRGVRGELRQLAVRTSIYKCLQHMYFRILLVEWTYSECALFLRVAPGAARYPCRCVFPGVDHLISVADDAIALGTTPRRERRRAVTWPWLAGRPGRNGV